MHFQYNLRLINLNSGKNHYLSPTFRFYKNHGVYSGAKAIFIKVATQVAGEQRIF